MAVGQVWPNVSQAYAIDLLDPNTRAAQPSTYFGAWGSGSATPAITDTTPQTENPEARVAIPNGSITQLTTESAGDTIQWQFTMTVNATGPFPRIVQEVCVLSLAALGILHVRIVHGSLSLETGDSVTYLPRLRLAEKTEYCP